MRELPILFSTPMVQAILDGRKIMTRRTVKNIPEGTHRVEQIGESLFEAHWGIHGNSLFLDGATEIKCPYQPGDRLYVRETWRRYSRRSECTCYEYCHCPPDGTILYYADCGPDENKWKPSIHMPKAAARIWLEVTNVRVERLQEITEEDAIAEGCTGYPCGPHSSAMGCGECANTGWVGGYSPVREFLDLWNSLNAKRGYGWEVNPFCWVIEFRRIEP